VLADDYLQQKRRIIVSTITEPASDVLRKVLAAVAAHPKVMSPILLEYLLRGEKIGRMEEKGLCDSPHHGVLRGSDNWAIADGIGKALEAGYVTRTSGFYPGLFLTSYGTRALAIFESTANALQSFKEDT
jgi:hypothetical protein